MGEGRTNMTEKQYNREEAWRLLTAYNQNEALIKHALAVEAVMRHFAVMFGEDEVQWGIIGLLHDLDYERYPNEHCIKVRQIMADEGWPEPYIHAVQSHGWKICCDVEPIHRMEKVLYTIDELTGFITAVALVRPSKSILDLEVKSVKKKWKEKAFAAGVNRAVIESGAQSLGMPLDEVIAQTIAGMKQVAASIELKGNL
jgi:predicted hydrolase (HD superfamily)